MLSDTKNVFLFNTCLITKGSSSAVKVVMQRSIISVCTVWDFRNKSK